MNKQQTPKTTQGWAELVAEQDAKLEEAYACIRRQRETQEKALIEVENKTTEIECLNAEIERLELKIDDLKEEIELLQDTKDAGIVRLNLEIDDLKEVIAELAKLREVRQ